MKIIVMAGTRPEVIKVAPVIKILKKSNDVDVKLCATGQHRELVQQSLADFELQPDFNFDLMRANQTLSSLSASLLAAVDPLLEREKPDWLLVQGDTTTVMVSALCAFYRGISIGHIEAGLRTYIRSSPFPEEINRQIVSRLSDLHFTPTKQCTQNLLDEGTDPESIVMTGNTVVDALLIMNDIVSRQSGLIDHQILNKLDAGKKMVLITAHRRENFGHQFQNICKSILHLDDTLMDTFFVYPVHLNPNVKEPVVKYLGRHPRIILLPPLGYKSFIAILKRAYLVLTDSGGIQEEAPTLGIPVLVMRTCTERPEAIDAGASALVGTNPEMIFSKTSEILENRNVYNKMARAGNPYGDGRAAERIVTTLLNYAPKEHHQLVNNPPLTFEYEYSLSKVAL
jgi:UDP-N-acetylglucosamine 2-epimerase